MFEFEKICEIMSCETKVSTKTQKEYTILRLLTEDLSTLDVVFNGKFNTDDLVFRNEYKLLFRYINKGSYSTLTCQEIYAA